MDLEIGSPHDQLKCLELMTMVKGAHLLSTPSSADRPESTHSPIAKWLTRTSPSTIRRTPSQGGKGKGSPTGFDFDKKKQLEAEIHGTLFTSGERKQQLEKEILRRVPGDSSSILENGGSSKVGKDLRSGVKARSGPGNGGKTISDLGRGTGSGTSGGGSFFSFSEIGGLTKAGTDLGSTKAGNSGGGASSSPPEGVEVPSTEIPGKSVMFGSTSRSGGAGFGRPRSFAQVARGHKRAAIADRLQHMPSIDGDCIDYLGDEIAESSVEWAASMIGVVMGPFIPSVAIMKFIQSQWKVKPLKLFIKPSGILVFKFEGEEDRRWVLVHGPWSIGSSPLLLKPWDVGEAMDWSSFHFVPVWTRILDIPPIFCTNAMLRKIGSGIGLPLCIDEFTSSQEMISFARMLIEVNAEQVKRKFVKLRNESGVECKLKVIFEWLPWCCDVCCCFGHLASSCPNQTSMKGAGILGMGLGAEARKSGSDEAGVHNDRCEGEAADAAAGSSSKEPSANGAYRSTATYAAKSIGIQTEMEENITGESHGVSSTEDEVPIGITQVAEGAKDLTVAPVAAAMGEVPAGGAQDHEKSLACARMVASSWAAEEGIYANGDGELEINECKTPDGLLRWKIRGGVRKGAYLLRGTKARMLGDLKVSLTMDELYNVMSGIKNPYGREDETAHFNEESGVEECGDSSSDDEPYHPG